MWKQLEIAWRAIERQTAIPRERRRHWSKGRRVEAVEAELLNGKSKEKTYSKRFRIDAVLDQADAERELLAVEVCVLQEICQSM